MNYLSIGHLCHDLVDQKFILGGSASYASMVAAACCDNVEVLTSFGSDFLYEDEFENISIHNKQSDYTTVFENIYEEDLRKQKLHNKSFSISLEDVGHQLQEPDIVHICPIINEVDPHLITTFEHCFVGVTPQGWMRQVNERKEVLPKKIDWKQLVGADAVVISEDDVDDLEAALMEMKQFFPLIVVTKGAADATVFFDDISINMPTFPSHVIDPTGAGDSFASAFFIKYNASESLIHAMGFAHAVASIVIEKEGVQVLKKEEIDLRFEQYKTRYSTYF